MRQSPPDVTPVVHQGIRYEAPHPSKAADEGAARLRLISEHLEKAMRKDMAAGRPVNPQDPEWLEQALADCPVEPAEVEAFLELMAFQAAVAPVMMRVTQQLLSQAIPGGGILPTLEGDEMRQALERDGSLTPAQIDRVLSDITGPFSSAAPQRNGGRLLAYDDASGEKLWELQVYENGENADVFVRELRLEGGLLVVRDEQAREHRVDLATRQLIA